MDTRTDIPAMWNDFWSRDWSLPGQQGRQPTVFPTE